MSTATLNDRFRDAAQALQAGDRERGVALLADAIDHGLTKRAPLPGKAFFQLGVALYELGRAAEAEARVRQGLGKLPKDFALNNLLGVLLKNQGRHAEALAALALAEKADPKSLSPLINRGNVYLAMNDGPRAVELYKRLSRLDPKEPEHLRLHGVALRLTGDLEGALRQFELARQLAPKDDRAWVDSASALRELERHEEAAAMVDRALQAAGPTRALNIAKARVLTAGGRHDAARAHLQAVLAAQPDAAWAHYQLGRALAPFDRPAANQHLREAVRLEPRNPDHLVALADSLDRTRGDTEQACIQEGHETARRALALGVDLLPHSRVLVSILERCADHEGAARLVDFERHGRFWASTNQPWALHHHLSRVRHAADRRELVAQHRLWGESVEAVARRSPLRKPARTAKRSRIRVGVMSSDLRHHPVSYFALPLLEGYDRSRFEFFCYSWSTHPVDDVQRHIAAKVDQFRAAPLMATRDAAQLIADDDVDILFELGGTTDMNKLEVMAWRPAPIGVSWLGYPHSAGLATIDHILVDPWIKPEDPALLIEQPFELDYSWMTLGRLGFNDRHAIEPGTPEQRTGRLTFGTMNNPYKYRPQTLAAWAEVVRRVPGSRFLFVRPEGGVPAFREHIHQAFEAGGVSRDRVEFIAVRGTHMQHYNAIDIALDSFPQTGGTTTCESLWMGVPVVTLVGEAFFERLSYSNLMNAGLDELCTFDRDAYVAKAVELAADAPKRAEWRHGLRQQIRCHPLGRPDLFVDDFQRAIERTVRQARA